MMKEVSEIIKDCENEIERLSSRDLDMIGESYKNLMSDSLEYWKSIQDNCVFRYDTKDVTYLVNIDDKIKIFHGEINPICFAEISLTDMKNLIHNYDNREKN